MTDMAKRVAQINRFYAAKTPLESSAPDRSGIASNAARTRWVGRGGPSVTIRISSLLAARLYEVVPQPDRRPFVEAAIEARLNTTGGTTQQT